CATAARHLAPGGFFACVFPVDPPSQHERLLQSVRSAGLAIVRWRPVILREGSPPLLGLFGMVRSEDLPEGSQSWREPPLVIRESGGSIHPEYSAIKMSFGFPP